jgi:hypothetical protein
VSSLQKGASYIFQILHIALDLESDPHEQFIIDFGVPTSKDVYIVYMRSSWT